MVIDANAAAAAETARAAATTARETISKLSTEKSRLEEMQHERERNHEDIITRLQKERDMSAETAAQALRDQRIMQQSQSTQQSQSESKSQADVREAIHRANVAEARIKELSDHHNRKYGELRLR